jgi:signal transduction histidine kinase
MNLPKMIHESSLWIVKQGGIKLKYSDNYLDKMVCDINGSQLDMDTILLNLFSNSKKNFAKEIKISFEKKEDIMLIYFHDNGVGIEKNIEKNIFQMGFSTKET